MAQTSAAKNAAQNKSANGIDPRRQPLYHKAAPGSTETIPPARAVDIARMAAHNTPQQSYCVFIFVRGRIACRKSTSPP